MTTGDKIWTLRRAQGLTVSQLAKRVGYHEKSVYRWEGTDPVTTIRCLLNFAQALGVAGVDLLDDADREQMLRGYTLVEKNSTEGMGSKNDTV